jgi:hypothetical protein
MVGIFDPLVGSTGALLKVLAISAVGKIVFYVVN